MFSSRGWEMVKVRAERLPIFKYNLNGFPFCRPFRLKRVLCCALRIPANLIDGIAQWISQSYYIVDSRTRLSLWIAYLAQLLLAVELGRRKRVYTSVPKHYIPFDPSTTVFTLPDCCDVCLVRLLLFRLLLFRLLQFRLAQYYHFVYSTFLYFYLQ